MKPIDLFNFTIKSEKYVVNGNKTTCDMVVKINLKEFERETFFFTNSFIRHTISKYLPIIKVVRKYNNDVAAKYYIYPNGKVIVLAFDNEYFNQTRNKQYSIKTGDIVTRKSMVNGCEKNLEYNEYHYCETFNVSSSANCGPSDTFDENVGRHVALTYTMLKICTRIKGLFAVILNEYTKSSELLTEAFAQLHNDGIQMINNLQELTKD